jgi:nicotinate dehydrogenase subunit B
MQENKPLFNRPFFPSSNRRTFLKSAGTLTIGFSLWGGCWVASDTAENQSAPLEFPRALQRHPRINAWLQVLADGRVRIFSGKVELGQGIRIAIKQVAAEELNLALDQVEVVLAETGRTPDEGYTAGSASIQGSAMSVRYAAAAAREKLLRLAAAKLQLPVSQLQCTKGWIQSQGGSQKLTFHELLQGQQIEEEVQAPLRLKPKSEYLYVGQAISREDTFAFVTGQPAFIQDLQLPDMVHGRVLRPLNYQSRLIRFDRQSLQRAFPSVLKTVVQGSFLGILTKREYEAERVIQWLRQNSKWSRPAIFPPQAELQTHIQNIAEAPEVVEEKGSVSNLSPDNANALQARFFKPYTMHASLGPACAIARYDGDVLHIWSHSQGIYPLREAIKSMLGLTSEQVHIISVPGAGCFGHTVADDAAADAALLAMAHPGPPVKVQWSREDEHAWEPYGSAMIMEIAANLDERGKISHWHTQVWTDSHSTRPNQDAGTVLAARYLDPPMPLKGRGYLGGGHRNANPYYQIPNLKVEAHFFDGPLRVSSLRSLGAYANIFAIESFMDKLAEKAGADPVQFRLDHLEDERAQAVLEEVRKMTRRVKPKTGEGLGYAFCRYKNNTSYCAMAAQVSVGPGKQVRIVKMWAAVDVGEVINRDGIRNQVEGGMVQAASWTLREEVKFDAYQITSRNWDRYPIFHMGDTPDIEVAILARPEKPAMGGGEVATPPVAAAIANAIYRACGQRVYELPVRLG